MLRLMVMGSREPRLIKLRKMKGGKHEVGKGRKVNIKIFI